MNIGDTVKINAPGLPGNGLTGKIVGKHSDHFQIDVGPDFYKNPMIPADKLRLIKSRKPV